MVNLVLPHPRQSKERKFTGDMEFYYLALASEPLFNTDGLFYTSKKEHADISPEIVV